MLVYERVCVRVLFVVCVCVFSFVLCDWFSSPVRFSLIPFVFSTFLFASFARTKQPTNHSNTKKP